MIRVNLQYFIEPFSIAIPLSLLMADGIWITDLVTIDTGAENGLMPISMLHTLEHRVIGYYEIEQAGLSHHYLEAIEAEIVVKIIDEHGNDSRELLIPMLFADTSVKLVGFDGFLNEVVLHVDAPRLSGYVEIV